MGSGKLPETDFLPHTFLRFLHQGTAQGLPVLEAAVAGSWIGRYRLVEKLGEGGFGAVWKAHQEEPVRREVALKLLKPGRASADTLARFAYEQQALTVMEHPGIAMLLDAGYTEAGQPFFVMPLIRGRSITRYCDHHQLDLRHRLELFVRVCDAVDHAHRRGILHRDLSPSNVMVEDVDGHPKVWVIDFGVSKAVGADDTSDPAPAMTACELIIGKPQYMSPEQASGSRDIDTRSDVYSLGTILYEMLTGSPPLEAGVLNETTRDQVWKLVRETEIKPPSLRLLARSVDVMVTLASDRRTTARRLRDQVRGELDWIVMRALEKQRDRRYSGAAVFAEDLRRYLRGEPVEAGPPSGAYRLKKYLRRHWLPVSGAAAIAFAVLAGGGISFWQWRLARQSAAETRDSLHALIGVELKEATHRGDSARVLKLVDKARLARYPRSDDLLFYEIEAREAIGDSGFPDFLFGIDRAALGSGYRPRLDFWRAERLIQDGKMTEGMELVQAALRGPLPPLEAALARGLTSERTEEALEHYGKAVEISPYRTVSQRNLILGLLLTGRVDEARTHLRISQRLLPDEGSFHVLEALLEAFQMNPTAGITALERLPESAVELKNLFLPLIEPLSNFSRDLVLGVCGNSPELDLLQQLRLTQSIMAFQAAAGERGVPPGWRGVSPVLTRGLQGMVQSLSNYNATPTGQDASVRLLTGTLKSNDEGTLWALLGSMESARGRYQDAAHAFERAQATPALIRHVREAARLMQGVSEAGAWMHDRQAGRLQLAVEAWADAFESDLPREAFTSLLASGLIDTITLKYHDRTFARRIAARLTQKSVEQFHFLAKIEYAEGNRTKALELAQEALSLYPANQSLSQLVSEIMNGTLPLPQTPAKDSSQGDKE